MEKDKKSKSTELQAPSKSEPTASSKPTFTLDRLRKDCHKLFGITESTYDGATFGLSGEYTVEALRNVIEKWQNTQVCPAKKEGK
jgi:hypothetical protein